MDLGGQPGKVSIGELSWVTFVNHKSIIEWLHTLGFVNAGEIHEDPNAVGNFSCAELCHAIVDSIPADERPPTSDVGCRSGGENEPPVVCDVDNSLEGLFDEEVSDLPEEDDYSDHESQVSSLDVPLFDKSPAELTITVANRFRIYPMLNIKVYRDVGDVEMMNEDYTDEFEPFHHDIGVDMDAPLPMN